MTQTTICALTEYQNVTWVVITWYNRTHHNGFFYSWNNTMIIMLYLYRTVNRCTEALTKKWSQNKTSYTFSQFCWYSSNDTVDRFFCCLLTVTISSLKHRRFDCNCFYNKCSNMLLFNDQWAAAWTSSTHLFFQDTKFSNTPHKCKNTRV